MERYTSAAPDGYTAVGTYEQIVSRLGRFEDLVEYLLLRQRELPKELAVYRENGKTKSYRFRELLLEKMVNETLLSLLHQFKLSDEP